MCMNDCSQGHGPGPEQAETSDRCLRAHGFVSCCLVLSEFSDFQTWVSGMLLLEFSSQHSSLQPPAACSWQHQLGLGQA